MSDKLCSESVIFQFMRDELKQEYDRGREHGWSRGLQDGISQEKRTWVGRVKREKVASYDKGFRAGQASIRGICPQSDNLELTLRIDPSPRNLSSKGREALSQLLKELR